MPYLNPITPSPRRGISSCSAWGSRWPQPIGDPRDPMCPTETPGSLCTPRRPQGPHVPHSWAQTWVPLTRLPPASTRKGANPTHRPRCPPRCHAPVLRPPTGNGHACWTVLTSTQHLGVCEARTGVRAPTPTPVTPSGTCSGGTAAGHATLSAASPSFPSHPQHGVGRGSHGCHRWGPLPQFGGARSAVAPCPCSSDTRSPLPGAAPSMAPPGRGALLRGTRPPPTQGRGPHVSA